MGAFALFIHIPDVHIDGIFGNAQMVGDGDDGILQIEDALLIQQGDDLLIFIGGGDGQIAVDRFFGIFQSV